MENERIEELFFLLCGEDAAEMEEKRAALCGQLCAAAKQALERELRTDCPKEEIVAHIPALEDAAAAGAFYQLALLDDLRTPEELRTQDVQVDFREQSRKAKAYREEKRKAVAHLLVNSDFYFGSVET